MIEFSGRKIIPQKKTFSIALVILAIFGLNILCGCNGKRFSREPGRYYNSRLGYSVIFPSGWIKASTPVADTIVFVSPQKDKDGFAWDANMQIGVIIGNENDQIDLDDFSRQIINAQQQEHGRSLLNEFFTTIDGNRAIGQFFEHRLYNKVVLKLAYMAIVDGHKIYLITFDTTDDRYPNYQQVFQDVVDSFRFER